MKKYKLFGEILSPLHIGTGSEIEFFDYIIKRIIMIINIFNIFIMFIYLKTRFLSVDLAPKNNKKMMPQ